MRTYTAIATAAMEMLGGEEAVRMSRKPEIMGDAAYFILTKNSRELTGQFLIDDEVVKQNGINDLEQYANVPGKLLFFGIYYAQSRNPYLCICVSVFVFSYIIIAR